MTDYSTVNENLLSLYTDMLLQGQADLMAFLQEHSIDFDSTLGRLMRLADYVYQLMPHVKPSPEFVESLYFELVGLEDDEARDYQFQFERQLERQLERFRHLPRPMQLAAGLTITAGFFWIAARVRREGLFSGDNDQEEIEKTA